MYLFERVFALSIYLLVVLLGYVFLKRCRSKDGYKRTLLFICLSLCCMAFCYVPPETADLHRWYELARDLSILQIEDVIKYSIDQKVDSIIVIIVWAISQCDLRLLPVLCSFFFFRNIFKILLDTCSRNAREKKLPLFYLFFMSLGLFVEVISGIRCMLALSFVARGVYILYIEKSSYVKSLLFVVIGSLLHPLALGLSALSVIHFLFINKDNKVRLSVIAIIVLIGILNLGWLMDWFNFVYDRALGYIYGDVYFMFVEYMLRCFLIVFLLIPVFYFVRKQKLPEDLANLFSLTSLVLFLNIGLFFEYTFFHRVSSFLLFISIPILCFYFDGVKKMRFLTFVSLIFLFLGIARGNMSSLKFFII